MNLESIIMLAVSALTMFYLIYALLRPEKFCQGNLVDFFTNCLPLSYGESCLIHDGTSEL